MRESTSIGILLCAGRGTRFDSTGQRDKLMQVLPDGETVASASARKLLAATGRVVAVVRPGREELERMLLGVGCEVVVCEDAQRGMSASLRSALLHVPEAHSWLLALADMPFVQASTYQALLTELRQGRDMVVPMHDGKRGNPVGFGRAHLDALLALSGDAGARSLLSGPGLTVVPVDDRGIHRDIDTPGDLPQVRHD